MSFTKNGQEPFICSNLKDSQTSTIDKILKLVARKLYRNINHFQISGGTSEAESTVKNYFIKKKKSSFLEMLRVFFFK